MPLPGDLSEQTDIALALAGVLEQELGDETLLTIGDAQSSVGEVLGGEPMRAMLMTFTVDGTDGRLALVALDPFAQRMEAAAADELMATTATPPLEASANKVAEIAAVNLEMDAPHAASDDELAALLQRDDLVVFPILEARDPVACLVIAIGAVTTSDVPNARPVETAPPAATKSLAPTVLSEVEMGVTAELGRTEMTVRELLTLTPGAVIDLDRTAGAPVDVLVNGTPIARGEVVVIDEQFGIRISEILTNAAST